MFNAKRGLLSFYWVSRDCMISNDFALRCCQVNIPLSENIDSDRYMIVVVYTALPLRLA